MPTQNVLYANTSSEILILDSASLAIIATRSELDIRNVVQSGKYLYVNSSGSTIIQIDTSDLNAPTHSVSFGPTITDFVLNSDGSTLYVLSSTGPTGSGGWRYLYSVKTSTMTQYTSQGCEYVQTSGSRNLWTLWSQLQISADNQHLYFYSASSGIVVVASTSWVSNATNYNIVSQGAINVTEGRMFSGGGKIWISGRPATSSNGQTTVISGTSALTTFSSANFTAASYYQGNMYFLAFGDIFKVNSSSYSVKNIPISGCEVAQIYILNGNAYCWGSLTGQNSTTGIYEFSLTGTLLNSSAYGSSYSSAGISGAGTYEIPIVISSASIDSTGLIWTITCSVDNPPLTGSRGWEPQIAGLSYSFSSYTINNGNVITAVCYQTAYVGQVATLGYNQSGGDFEDSEGNLIPNITNMTATNNSTQVVSFQIESASIAGDGITWTIVLEDGVAPISGDASGFTATVAGEYATFSTAYYNGLDLICICSVRAYAGTACTLSYSGTNIVDSNGLILTKLSTLAVSNATTGSYTIVPGTKLNTLSLRNVYNISMGNNIDDYIFAASGSTLFKIATSDLSIYSEVTPTLTGSTLNSWTLFSDIDNGYIYGQDYADSGPSDTPVFQISTDTLSVTNTYFLSQDTLLDHIVPGTTYAVGEREQSIVYMSLTTGEVVSEYNFGQPNFHTRSIMGYNDSYSYVYIWDTYLSYDPNKPYPYTYTYKYETLDYTTMEVIATQELPYIDDSYWVIPNTSNPSIVYLSSGSTLYEVNYRDLSYQREISSYPGGSFSEVCLITDSYVYISGWYASGAMNVLFAIATSNFNKSNVYSFDWNAPMAISKDLAYAYCASSDNIYKYSLSSFLEGSIGTSGTTLSIVISDSTRSPILATSGFSLTVNGVTYPLGTYTQSSTTTLTLPIEYIVAENAVCVLSYTPGDCTLNGTALTTVSNLLCTNNSTVSLSPKVI